LKRKGLIAFAVGFSFLMAGLFPAEPGTLTATSQQLTLRFASPFTEATVLGYGPAQFMRMIEERTNGRIRFQTFWGGTLVKPGELVDSCGNGVVDLVHGLWIYDPGKLPLNNYESNFFFNDPDLMHSSLNRREMFQRIPALQAELSRYNLGPPLLFNPVSSYDFLSREPVRTLADLRGKKIGHTPVEHVGAYKTIGATSVITPAGNMYNMLQRGVVDLVSIPTEIFDMFKLQEVGQYLISGGFNTMSSCSLWINRDVWDRLDADERTLFVEVGKEADQRYVENLKRVIEESLEEYRKAGLRVTTLSEADREQWAAAMPDLPGEWAEKMEAKGLPGWEVVNTYREISAQFGWTFPGQN